MRMKFSGKSATAIIVYPENKILLAKRTTPPFIGYWALPGGRAEEGETAEQNVVREVKEETGLAVELLYKLGSYKEQGIQGGYEYNYNPTCFVAKPVGGELKNQESEIAELRLFSLDEVPKELAFKHGQMVKDYLAKESKT